MDRLNVLLASQVLEHGAESMRQALSALPQWIDADAESAAKQPKNTDRHPSSEEFSAEDVAGAVHWEWPQDKQGNGHDAGHGFGDLGCLIETSHFFFNLLWGLLAVTRDGLDVHAGFFAHLRVVSSLNILHGLPVIMVETEYGGEEWDENQW